MASPVRTPQEPFPLSHFSGQSVGLSTQRARVRTPQVPFLCHKSRNRSRSYRIGSYRIASHRIVSNRIVSNRIVSDRIVSHRTAFFASSRLASPHITARIWFHKNCCLGSMLRCHISIYITIEPIQSKRDVLSVYFLLLCLSPEPKTRLLLLLPLLKSEHRVAISC